MGKNFWSWLQLFAGEGSGEGGEGSATGVTASAPSEARLRELGVPRHVMENRAKRNARYAPKAAAVATAQPEQPAAQEQAAAAEAVPTEEKVTEEPKEQPQARMTWKQIMEDPEYNQEMQKTMQSRLKKAGKAEEAMEALAPMLEVLARANKMDPNNLDYAALAKAVSDDNRFYEDKAVEMGTTVEVAKKHDQLERENARMAKIQDAFQKGRENQAHLLALENQAQEMRKVVPDFDLRKELQNQKFALWTSPQFGMSVKDAFYALHHDEINSRAMQVTAEKTAQKLSNAIQAGGKRPQENGTAAAAPSVTTFDYSKMTRQERNALKQRIYTAGQRGEKVYPGR